VSEKARQISALLAPTVQALGLELLGVEYLPAPGSATLRLYLDVVETERGTREVNIDDCEKVSREVSAQLDVEDPISGNYTLEVSSPGIERPLFEAAHFARFIGEQAKALLKLPQDGRRRVQGQILRVDGSNIVFVIDGVADEFIVASDNIEKARLVPDWVALGLAPQPKKKPSAGKPANKQPKQPAAKKSQAK
jgi:ribosome maturation factor RimP